MSDLQKLIKEIKYCRQMPRTALRYSIERLDPKERERYLAKQG